MTVFMLGAGVMQLPALSIARELGWTVTCADGNPAAPGAALADRFLHVDLKDDAGLEAAARAVKAEFGLDAVFTAGTDFSAAVARLAARFGLPGHSPEAARLASDKVAMREALARAGVPSARFVEVRPGQDPRVLAAELGYPLVVKPADSMGARGCRAVRGPAELEAAVAAALPHSRSGRAIVEEYIEGPEFSVDAIVAKGRISIRGLADRHIAFAPYFVELGHTMPSVAEDSVRRAVLAVFEAGVGALGLGHGAAKGDIKWCPSRGCAVVGEIAARLSGGYMSGWTYPYASGLEPTREALLVAAGLEPAPPPPDRGAFSAERAFISIPGRVRETIGLRAAETLPGVKAVFLRALPGSACSFPRNNVEKAGNVITVGATRDEAVGSARRALRGILPRLAPGDAATEAFLAGEGREGDWPPPAFELPPGLARLVDTMPERLPASSPGGLRGLLAALPGAEGCAAEDWSGRGLLESAELALELFARPGSGPGVLPAGAGLPAGRFWRALVRGGAQAALYVLDTEALGRGEA